MGRLSETRRLPSWQNKPVPEALDELKHLADRLLWRPMESAPRDGTRILIYVPDDDDGETHKVASWGPSPYRSGWSYRGGWMAGDVPQCWMPLPEPPSQIEE